VHGPPFGNLLVRIDSGATREEGLGVVTLPEISPRPSLF